VFAPVVPGLPPESKAKTVLAVTPAAIITQSAMSRRVLIFRMTAPIGYGVMLPVPQGLY
jgi:hypothetical protein